MTPASRALVATIAAAATCGSAAAQLVQPRTASERAWVASIAATMTACFTTLGPRRDFPVAVARPPQGELLAAVLLPASGPRVGDGYNYMLLLHGPSNAAFVEQLGGFAATPRVYGPLPLDTRCDDATTAKPAGRATSAPR